MMTKCPECGSSEIVPDLVVFAHGGNIGSQPIYVNMEEPAPAKRPFGWAPNTETVGFRAAICGECGHAEFYTRHYADLLAAHKKGYKSKER